MHFFESRLENIAQLAIFKMYFKNVSTFAPLAISFCALNFASSRLKTKLKYLLLHNVCSINGLSAPWLYVCVILQSEHLLASLCQVCTIWFEWKTTKRENHAVCKAIDVELKCEDHKRKQHENELLLLKKKIWTHFSYFYFY